MKGFAIAGTASGVGKTTITAASLTALRTRGLTVQPFKCGPNYIDPAHHAGIAGRPSYNLDTWMLPIETNRSIFRAACCDVDVAVVEGVMGLFDGVSGSSDTENQPFFRSLREFVASGRPVYAEYGGLMYLAAELTTLDGGRHKMASILSLAIEMLTHLESFGYTEVELGEDCLIGRRGTRLRGHCFHYSRVTRAGNLGRCYRARQVLTGTKNQEGYCIGNVLASYIQSCRQARAVAL